MPEQSQVRSRNRSEVVEPETTRESEATRERLVEASEEACCVLDAIDDACCAAEDGLAEAASILDDTDDGIFDPMDVVPKFEDYANRSMSDTAWYRGRAEYNKAMKAWAQKYDQKLVDCCGTLKPAR